MHTVMLPWHMQPGLMPSHASKLCRLSTVGFPPHVPDTIDLMPHHERHQKSYGRRNHMNAGRAHLQLVQAAVVGQLRVQAWTHTLKSAHANRPHG